MAGRDVRESDVPPFAVGRIGFIVALLLLWSGASAWSQGKVLKVEGRDYLDLATAGARFGMEAYWLKGHETFRLRSQWTTIDFRKNSRVASVNRVPVTLGFPTEASGGRLYLSEADHRHVLQPILTPQAFADPPDLRRIVLDPGHGGSDSGALNQAYGLKEKDLTLDVALRLARMLRAAGYEVVLTRETDRFIPLEQRTRIANYERADLFLSLHFNAATNAQAAGYETFVLTPQYQPSSSTVKPGRRDAERFRGNDQDPWNALIGYHVQRSLVSGHAGPDRGLKRARFLVLKHLECPGALLELGFVSHPQSAQRIRQASHREELAQSLFDGVRAYHQRLRRIR
jgi:N-acetylmuramoyl-L-alanine amidase